VDHDQPGHLDSLLRRYMRPQLVPMNALYELRVGDRVGGVRVGEDDEEADDGGYEEESACRKQVGPGLAKRSRQGLDVETADPLPDLAAAPVDDAVAAGDQPVEIS